MFAALIVSLVTFYTLVSIFSDGAGSKAPSKIVALALVVTLLMIGICNEMPTRLGLAYACAAGAIVSLAGLVFWVNVTRIQAVKITASYIGLLLAYLIVIDLVFHPLGAHAA